MSLGRKAGSLLQVASRPFLLLFFQLCLVFFLFSAIPGDPVRNFLGPTADQAAVEQLRAHLGHDEPPLKQFLGYLGGIAKGDFGYSLSERAPAGDVLGRGLMRTAGLGAIAIFVALLLAVSVALLDTLVPRLRLPLIGAVDAISMIPAFVIALVCAYLFLRIAPASISPADTWRGLLLPALSVSLAPAALLTAQLLRTVHRLQRSDAYISGRAFGLSRIHLFVYILFPSALFVWLENVKNILATVWLLTLIAEFIFSIRGLSSVMVQAVQFKDAPLLQGFVVINCIAFAIVAELIDLSRHAVRPR